MGQNELFGCESEGRVRDAPLHRRKMGSRFATGSIPRMRTGRNAGWLAERAKVQWRLTTQSPAGEDLSSFRCYRDSKA
jgi:hypothetical protein